MAFNARQHGHAILAAAALILTPAAANAQGDLLQGLFKSLKKEKTVPVAPQEVAPVRSKRTGPAPSGKAATKAAEQQPEASKKARKAQPAPAPPFA